MQQMISGMLERYERGGLSRRDLIQGLAALALGAGAGNPGQAAAKGVPAPAEPPFKGVDLNHIAIRVTDVPRSRDFYSKLLGLPVVRDSAGSAFLGLGPDFLALFRSSAPGLDHYCISVENYEVGAVTEKLRGLGLNPRQPAGSRRVYFSDPDGLTVQFSESGHQP
jgi:catechol 2,3-dioxygenase-like lactoylglutathione lyase family enzyme